METILAGVLLANGEIHGLQGLMLLAPENLNAPKIYRSWRATGWPQALMAWLTWPFAPKRRLIPHPFVLAWHLHRRLPPFVASNLITLSFGAA